MKFLKTFILAALVTTAFAGPPSAMAETTALCTLDPGTGEHEVCPSSSLISHVHESSLPGDKARLKANSFTVDCDVLFLGEVNAGLLLAAVLKVFGNFTYTNCTNGCTVAQENESLVILVSKEGHETAFEEYNPQMHVVCGKVTNCLYKAVGVAGIAKGFLLSGEENGELTIAEQELSGKGILCSSTIVRLSIKTTPLEATSITE